ncbi:hypothetical protein Cflav_PD2064 [Pedosphaera parvula Ellin514]|uniref:Uncharacterized protein n=1 Tax=Pedosphaera parvula (strain Ellin514) TaxID=320771 RepID=B9XMH3_PEDPL|nr:hypothetical protein Cflav_PD2064 [Pedosphaera parvula Ellin514]
MLKRFLTTFVGDIVFGGSQNQALNATASRRREVIFVVL